MSADQAAGLPAIKVLFCCRAGPEYYRHPLFSTREVFCGPECQDVTGEEGVASLRTPAGEYDLTQVIARLPADQAPELVVVKADATRGNFPRNLDRLPCPKVLLVGDTHHFEAPIRALLSYAAMEVFDLILLDHTRQHAHFFLDAGFERVQWIPALDYAWRPRAVPDTPQYPLTFVGQTGAHHPYRRHVLGEILRAGLPLEVLRDTPERTADMQADSLVTLNCSLNGDLNLRVFEALGSGAFLLTDALKPDSGLDRLFTAERHLASYRTPFEAVERARHFLAHPDEAMRIRKEGHAHFLVNHHPRVKLRQFYDLLFNQRVDPALALDPPGPARVFGQETRRRRVEAYEAVQALHLKARRLDLHVDPDDVLGLAANAGDLPRVRVTTHAQVLDGQDRLPTEIDGLSDEGVLVLPWPEIGDLDTPLGRFRGDTVLAIARSWHQRVELIHKLEAWGFRRVQSGGVVFTVTDRRRLAERAMEGGSPEVAKLRVAQFGATAQTAHEAFAAALLARRLDDGVLEQRLLGRAVALDRTHAPALAALARAEAAAGRRSDQRIAAFEALRAGANDDDLPGLAEGHLAESDSAESGRSGETDPRVAGYRAVFAAVDRPSCGQRRRVLVVTNLFPPQEFGGYGRKLWEFSAELARRGHEVRILAANVPEFARPGVSGTADLEPLVDRSLELYGYWRGGTAYRLEDPRRCAEVMAANEARIQDTVQRFGTEVCLAGNIDMMTVRFLADLPARGVPVIHCVGNRHPGYSIEETPASPLYRLGAASQWVRELIGEAGFPLINPSVLYPGARVDSFYRPFPPAFDRLRIAFAGLFVTYKGPHVLLNALAVLTRSGVDFTCVVAGEIADTDLFARSKDFCERYGFADRVQFPGFLDRAGMEALYARSNVLVFPSSFDEPFGISHVEAMASGVAVVTSATGGSGEIVRDGVDGLRFRVDDHEDLAAKLAGLAADPLAWASLARAGQARAFAFTIPRSVDHIEESFEEMLT